MLFVDLDRFKAVNDDLGHAAGDRVLVATADRLSECVRPGDTVARLGGDEFAVVLSSPADLVLAETVAERVLRALRRPLDVAGSTVAVSASVGIVVSGADDTPETVLQASDVAMYEAKRAGGARAAASRTALRADAGRRGGLVERLQAAVRRNAFSLDRQPVVDVQSGTCVEVEVLLRWDDPVEGPVPPSTFLPLLEADGSLRQVGRWVLQQSCRDAVSWQRPGAPLQLTVDVSARQLADRDFVPAVRSALEESQLPAELLVLEVDESVLCGHTADVGERLAELRELGVRIALDHFGVGCSSLRSLPSLPIDVLKIDQTFLEDVPDDPMHAGLLAAVVDLGAALGLDVVVRGVEDPAQARWLRTTRCRLAQGSFYAARTAADAVPLPRPASPAGTHAAGR